MAFAGDCGLPVSKARISKVFASNTFQITFRPEGDPPCKVGFKRALQEVIINLAECLIPSHLLPPQ